MIPGGQVQILDKREENCACWDFVECMWTRDWMYFENCIGVKVIEIYKYMIYLSQTKAVLLLGEKKVIHCFILERIEINFAELKFAASQKIEGSSEIRQFF